ncbi:hypothetical protein B484DRAFT_405701 [Ochromonadaceae sp. CCMP2298]|nr:hypothetical protein B484DRAFT_405701 [Ochromonadaceae sp. CCMP2298]
MLHHTRAHFRARTANASVRAPPPADSYAAGLAAALVSDPTLAARVAANLSLFAEDVDMFPDYDADKENIDPTQETIGLTQEAMRGLMGLAYLEIPEPYDAFSRPPSVQSLSPGFSSHDFYHGDNFINIIDRTPRAPAREPFPLLDAVFLAATPSAQAEVTASVVEPFRDFVPMKQWEMVDEEAPIEDVQQELEIGHDFELLQMEDVDPASEFEALPEQLHHDWGQENANWVGFLRNFLSKERYEKIILELYFSEDNLIASIISYFDECYDAGLAPTTLRSRFSAVKKFWLHTGRGNLSQMAPLVESNLSKWDKFHDLPDTSRNLVMKAYAAVGTAIAGRGKEITALTFGDLKRVVDEEGVPAYHVSYDRDIAILKCSLGVQAVDKYLALFRARGRSDNLKKRLWRRCSTSKAGAITCNWTAQNIGVNTCKLFGLHNATALKPADPKSYMGHCWRRSAATLAANAGLSFPQIKALTGHRSDNSTYESKKRPADPTTEDRGHRSPTGHSSSSSSRAPHPQHRSSLQSPVTAPVYNIAVTITGDVSGSLSLLQKD